MKADDFTAVHRQIAVHRQPAPPSWRSTICRSGADSAHYGATGTVAKKRVIGGTSIRVTVDSAFGLGMYSRVPGDPQGPARRFCRAHPPVTRNRSRAVRDARRQDVDSPTGRRCSNSWRDLHRPRTSRRSPVSNRRRRLGIHAQKCLHWNAHRARTAYKAWVKKEN